MSRHPAVDAILSNLESTRNRYGDAAYIRAVEQAVKEVFRNGQEDLKAIVKETFGDIVDIARLERETLKTPAVDLKQAMAQQLKQQMPGLQTQAQFDVFMAAFDALRLYMGNVFSGQPYAQAKEALLKSLDVAVDATKLSEKLGHVPEASTNPEADKYKNPPKEFGETEHFQSLMTDLDSIRSREQLNQWYSATKAQREMIVSSSLRNQLFDNIRSIRAVYSGFPYGSLNSSRER